MAKSSCSSNWPGSSRKEVRPPSGPDEAPSCRRHRLLRHVPRSGPQQRGSAGGPVRNGGNTPEWNRVYMNLGGDSAHELTQADFSRCPEAVGNFVDTFLAIHQQPLLAEEDPTATFPPPRPRIGSIGRRWPLPSSCPLSPCSAECLPFGCWWFSPRSNDRHRRC